MLNWLSSLGLKSVMTVASVSAVATGSAVYVNQQYPDLLEQVGLFVSEPPQEIKSPVIKGEAKANQGAEVAKLAEPNESESLPAAPEKPVEEQTPAQTRVPAFDVMRVEKDGSLLVAGAAEPGSTVDLLTSDGTVIGSGKAGAEGDFVILPANPLEPGDYAITLRSTTPEGQEIVSAQTGIVKVPKRGEEMLAMISEPGKASEILAKPEKLQVDEEVSEPKLAEVKKEEPEAELNQTTAPSIKADTSTATPVVEEPQTPEPKSEIAKQPEPQQEAVAKLEEPKEKVVEAEPVQETKVEKTTQIEPGQVTEENPVEEEQVPVVQPEIPQVIVEAVEVEGDQIFVAGAVPKGSVVRIYIDNEPIGTSTGTRDDRFLVSRNFKLSAGEHSVRADVIDRKTGQVLSRAEVPLIHEIPEEVPVPVEPKVKVVAIPQTQPAEAEQPEMDKPEEEVAAVEKEQVAEPVKAAAPQKPKNVEVASADLNAVVEKKEPSASAEQKPKPVEKPAVAEVKSKKESITAPKESAVLQSQTEPVQSPQTEPEQPEPTQVAVIEPARPLVIRTGRAVIIKPGDNLWRISRKTYGRGIRYTTIYNANRSQIRNPHRIYIGQIFKIPQQNRQETITQ